MSGSSQSVGGGLVALSLSWSIHKTPCPSLKAGSRARAGTDLSDFAPWPRGRNVLVKLREWTRNRNKWL